MAGFGARALPHQRYLVFSKNATTVLAERIGLSRFIKAKMRLEKVEVIGESLRLHISWPGVGELKIALLRADGGERFCGTNRISIVAECPSVNTAFAMVMHRIAAALEDTTIDELCGLEVPQVENSIESPINTWESEPRTEFPRSARTFVCDHAIQRKLFESFRFEGPSSCIVHGDLECSFITPRSRVPLPRFFNYPSPLQGDAERFGATTDLVDLDVIGGGADKLQQSILQEIRAIGDAGPITVNTTCIPTVIGDDVERVVAEHAHMTRHGVFVVGPRTLEPVELYIRYLEKVVDRLEGKGGREGCVALVGFPEDQGTRELVQLLEDGGVEVTGLMLPRASESRMADVLEAKVIVFRPSSHLKPLYDRIFARIDRTFIAPDAPWGLEATRAWLRSVAVAVSRDVETMLDQRLAVITEEWERMRREAEQAAVAFVIDPSEAARVLDPHSMTGLPVVSVTREMGFSVRVLVYAGEPASFRDCRDRLEASLGRLGVTVQGFTTPEELAQGLREPVPAIVYSEFFYDRRITRLGLNQFSSREFEMGIAGAMRSLRRLLRLAKTRFYEDYRDHLRLPPSDWWGR